MILDCELYEELHPGESCKQGLSRKKRNAIRARKRLWTSRIVPYKIPDYMSKYTKCPTLIICIVQSLPKRSSYYFTKQRICTLVNNIKGNYVLCEKHK